MTESVPDVARDEYAAYRQLLDAGTASTFAVGVRAQLLANMVPRLLDEISRRDMLLTRVRALTGTECGLFDLPDDHPIPVGVLRAALDCGR